MPPKSKSKKNQIATQPRLEAELATSPIIPVTDPSLNKIYHAVNPGDMVAAMGAIKKYYEITGRKSIVYQNINQLASYYAGAVHPTVNEHGQNVCCNKPMFDMLKPLIESQEYIHSFEEYTGQQFDLDFHVIRHKTFVNLPHGAIQNWVTTAWPDLAFDLSKPWMFFYDDKCPEHIRQQAQGKIILNFTERYRNVNIDYYFLQCFVPELIFAGTEKEHYLFCSKWNLNIPRLDVKDFLELAYAYKIARFFLGNQSMGWNICDAVKVKRILELCQYAQNCIHGVGEDSYGYFHQSQVEYYFRRLYQETLRK